MTPGRSSHSPQGTDLPSWKSLEQLSQFELWQILPQSLMNRGLALFSQGSYVAFESALNPREGVEATLYFEGNLPAQTQILEEKKGGALRTRCNCDFARLQTHCPHQTCLVMLAWRILKFLQNGETSTLDLSANLRDKIASFAEIFEASELPKKNQENIPPLSSLILCLSEGPDLSNQLTPWDLDTIQTQLTIEPAPLVKIAPTQAPKKATFRYTLVAQATQERRELTQPFPQILTESPISGSNNPSYLNPYADYHHREKKALRNLLQYCFSDGLTLTAQELLYHPYSLGVPLDLLPTRERVILAPDQAGLPRLLTATSLNSGFAPLEADQALAQVIFSAHKREIPILLSDSSERSDTRRAIRIQRILASPPLQLEARLDLTQSNGPSTPEAPGRTLAFSLSQPAWVSARFGITSDASLFFHTWNSAVTEALSLLFTRGKFQLTQSSPLEISPATDLQLVLPEVKKIFAKTTGTSLNVLPKSVHIPQQALIAELHLSTEGNLQSTLRNPSSEDQIEGFLRHFSDLVLLLAEGLGSLSHEKNTQLATNRGGIKRDRDLKVLRHQGIAHALFQEVARGILAGLPGKEILTLVDEKGAIILHRVEGSTPDSFSKLSKLCSTRVWELVESFVLKCLKSFHEDSLFVYSAAGEQIFEGAFSKALELFLAWSEALAHETEGALFLKSKTPAPFKSPKKGDKDFLLRAFFPLVPKGFKIFLDGNPVEILSPLDLTSRFNLTEGADAPHPGAAKIDWFELNPQFFFKGVEISADQAMSISTQGLIHFGGKTYLLQNRNLPSLKRLQSFWERIAQGVRPSGNSRDKFSSHVYRLPRNHALEMLALRATGVEIQGGPKWQAICAFYDRLGEIRNDEPQGEIRAELMPYQKTGVQWLSDLYMLGLGGILADEMGLGKTLQTLTFLEDLRHRGELGHALIIVPTSLTFNWCSEAERFTPKLPIFSFQTRDKAQFSQFLSENPHAAVICTYGTLTEQREFFSQFPWNIHIFDEAQNLKNITAKRTTASRAIPARFKLCLTGTPLENHLGEFYSLMDLVVPGALGDLDDFRSKFVHRETLDKEDIKALRLTVKPLVLRRTKSEILKQLPEKSEASVKLVFDEEQRKIYRDVAVTWNEKIQELIDRDGESKSQLAMLTALLRLRQVCSDPSSLPNVKYKGQPPKIEVLLEALQEITESGDSALVFTQFLHTFERIRQTLEGAGIPCFTLHGGHTKREREKTLRGFDAHPGGAVLLMTLKTGGVGLNLTKASYVFHLEPWWNPAVENQATDRAHRLGQEKRVQVFRYLMRDSVEEKIELLKDRKAARFNAMFSSTEAEDGLSSEDSVGPGGSHLSKQDFEFLLGRR